MIKVKNISKSYGDLKAVNDISFEIESSEIVGLLGPNGAGKSTTMRIVAGFLFPDSGEVVVGDKNLQEYPLQGKALIGYMPENNPLYKDVLVKDAIKFALEFNHYPAENHQERIDFVVEATGLEKVFYKPISDLSKGYRQRVGLAKVLSYDPKILILDEPTEGLDPNQRAEIRKLVKNLGKDKTIIISTHVMQEVNAMCSRMIIIKDGEIILDNDKDKVIDQKSTTGWIEIQLRGDNVKTKFSKLEKDDILTRVKIKKTKDGLKRLRVKLADEKRSSERFSKEFSTMIAKNKWEILSMNSEKKSLEELFTQLTAK
jgi:ABC-2 type transport system ATP-binding protein